MFVDPYIFPRCSLRAEDERRVLAGKRCPKCRQVLLDGARCGRSVHDLSPVVSMNWLTKSRVPDQMSRHWARVLRPAGVIP